MIVGSDCLSKLSSSKAIPATILRHNSTYVFSFQLTLSIISLLRKKIVDESKHSMDTPII